LSINQVRRHFRECLSDRDGVAAIEFALISSVLVFLTLNVIDVAYYAALRMEVENAAQAGAQAAWQNCLTTPATTNCADFAADVTRAVQATSLGTAIALQSGSPSEGYYCVDSTGSLSYVGAVTSPKPTNCSSVGVSANQPGDWVRVQVTYTFSSLFPALTITATMASIFTETAWMRIG
jgi:Flp pilus assembly protein TadG